MENEKNSSETCHETIIKILSELGIKEYHREIPNYLLQLVQKIAQDTLLESKELAVADQRDVITTSDLKIFDKFDKSEKLSSDEMKNISTKLNSKQLPPATNKSYVNIPSEATLTNTNYMLHRPPQESVIINVNIPAWQAQNNRAYQVGIPEMHLTSTNNNPRNYFELVQRLKSSDSDKYYAEYVKKVLLLRHQNMK